jgi:excisionase family DNA binding protein
MNKKEAAAHLGISARSLERYTTQRRLSVTYEKGKTRPVAVYDADELAALKAELEAGVHHPAEATATNADNRDTNPANALSTFDTPRATIAQDATGGAIVHIDRMEEFARVLAAAIAQERRGATVADKLLLSLEECRTLTGLSRATLRSAIEDGALKARVIGRGFKVKRAELDKYIGKL